MMEQKNTPPSYAELDPKKQEEFLSGLGGFSPTQREIFHILCSQWQPFIPYSQILNRLIGLIKNPSFELDQLLDKFFTLRCGIVRLKIENQELHKEHIILTDPGDCRFYTALIQNMLTEFYYDPEMPLPLESFLHKKGFQMPEECTLYVPESEYVDLFNPSSEERPILLRLPVSEKECLLLPTGEGERLLQYCRAKARQYMDNPDIALEVAKILSLSITELRKRTEGSDSANWREIIRGMYSIGSDPLIRRKAMLDTNFLPLTLVLEKLLHCYEEEQKRKHQEAFEWEQDMEAVVRTLESQTEPLIQKGQIEERLRALKGKYGSKFDSFRAQFYHKYTENLEGTHLPQLILLKTGFLIRQRGYPFFIERLRQYRDILLETYTEEMIYWLKTNNRTRSTLFVGTEQLEQDMRDRLQKIDPDFAVFLEKPQILFELTYAHARETKKLQSTDTIKKELEAYFQPDSQQLKSLLYLFHISMLDLFLRSFGQLSFWRQIWFRISGRYATYLSRFQGKSTKMLSSTTAREAAVERKSPAAIQKSMPKTKYTRRQQEAAWEAFSKTIRSKKKGE
jgi:hypothetical protein